MNPIISNNPEDFESWPEDEMEYEINRDIKEQDRLNFQDLLKSEGELDTLTDTYMKDYDEWYEILRLVLKDGDSEEIGERMKKLKEGALFEYLTMLRKPYEGEL